MNSGNVLITGGSGFIGGEIVRQLSYQGVEMLNVDFQSPLRSGQERYWCRCDVRDRNRLAEVICEFAPNHIIHLASDIDVTMTRLEEYETTIEGTRNLVELSQRLPNLKRFVHISTQFVVTPGVRPKSETDFHPYTLYGEAKARSEMIVRGSGRADWVILRPTIIWGPWHPAFRDGIWKYIANRCYLHPSAKQPIMRCYGYVENTAEQIIRLASVDISRTGRRVFYVGDGTIDQTRWVDGFAIALTGQPAQKVPKFVLFGLGQIGEGCKKVGVRFPMDKGRYFRMTTTSDIDLEPTVSLVGTPKIAIEDGIRETVDWLLQIDPSAFHAIGV